MNNVRNGSTKRDHVVQNCVSLDTQVHSHCNNLVCKTGQNERGNGKHSAPVCLDHLNQSVQKPIINAKSLVRWENAQKVDTLLSNNEFVHIYDVTIS